MSGSQSQEEKTIATDTISDIDEAIVGSVDWDEEYSLPEQRKIIHRIDRRLISMTGLAYCVSMIDRTNLSMAAVAG